MRFHFRQGTLQLDFHRAIKVHFAQHDGSPGRHLDVAHVHSFEDDWEPDRSQKDDLPGPKLGLPGDLGDVERSGWDDGCGRQRGG